MIKKQYRIKPIIEAHAYAYVTDETLKQVLKWVLEVKVWWWPFWVELGKFQTEEVANQALAHLEK